MHGITMKIMPNVTVKSKLLLHFLETCIGFACSLIDCILNVAFVSCLYVVSCHQQQWLQSEVTEV